MRRAYKILLRLYPYDHRALFAAEMLTAFDQATEEYRGCGWAASARFLLAELTGLATGAGAEWIAKFSTDNSVRSRCLPDLRKMRPIGVPRELWAAGAGMKMADGSLPAEVMEAQRRITFLVGRMVHAIANHDFEEARSSSNEEREERAHLRLLLEKYHIDESPDTVARG